MQLPKLIWLPAFCLLAATALPAAIIGTNSATLPLTAERIAALPKSEQADWKKYLARSETQLRAEHDSFRNEMRLNSVAGAVSPPAGRGSRALFLNRSEEWYRADEALRIAHIIVSFQTVSGGWSKNLDLTHHRRAPGELFALGNISRFTNPTDLDLPHDPNWNYVGTFDNGATTTQLRFLAKVIAAKGVEKTGPFQKSFLLGLDYIFAAQYPNGGWPQVWPLQGGYHDAVTFNDGAMTAILDLLSDVSAAKAEFTFVPQPVRERAAASLERGMRCVLATQMVENGQRSAWCQQYDVLTLRPTSARNYEMPSLCSGESAGVMQFLMQLPAPDANVVAAVQDAAAWFRRTEIRDREFRKAGDDGRHLVAAPGSGPLWSRYYELGSNRPIFGDRDKTIHDTVEDLSQERRDGYSWFTDSPQSALKRFARWQETIAKSKAK